MSIYQLVSVINEVKTDNGRLRNDLTTLKERVVLLESNLNCSTTNHNFDVVLQLVQQLVECVSDAVVHGLPVSSSTLLTVRVTDDVKSLSDMAQHLSLSLPSVIRTQTVQVPRLVSTQSYFYIERTSFLKRLQ